MSVLRVGGVGDGGCGGGWGCCVSGGGKRYCVEFWSCFFFLSLKILI